MYEILDEVRKSAEADVICPSQAGRDLHAHLANIVYADHAYWAENFVDGGDTMHRGRLSAAWMANEISFAYADDLEAGLTFYAAAICWAQRHFAE